MVGHGAGIQLNGTSSNTVSHNLIHDTPRYGIYAWAQLSVINKPLSSITANNTIEFNDASRANTDSQDAGVINVLAVGPGNVISNNRVHDSHIPFSFGEGIYLDDDNYRTTVSKNLVHDLQQGGGGITLAGINIKGDSPRIINNIVTRNRLSSGDLRVVKNLGTGEIQTREVEIQRNILAGNNTGNIYALTQWDETQLKLADYNLFQHDGALYNVGFCLGPNNYCLTGPPTTTESLAQWRAGHGRKHDQNSMVADPKFVDPENRDFRLRPDSPAYALGFEDIDFGSIGLTADFPFADREEELDRLFVTSIQSGVGASIRLPPDGTTQLNVMGRTRTGYVANLANATIAFSSNNPNVATVDAQGLVEARGSGVATIAVTATKGGVSKTTVIYAVVGNSPPVERGVRLVPQAVGK